MAVYLLLQGCFDPADHFLVFRIGEEGLLGIHGKGCSPFKAVAVLGNQVKMQVTAPITVGTVVYLVRMECFVDGLGCSGNVFKECSPILSTDVYQFTDMVLVSNDHTAGMTLFLEQDQLTNLQITDLDSKPARISPPIQ